MSYSYLVMYGRMFTRMKCDSCGMFHHHTRASGNEGNMDNEVRVDGRSVEGDFFGSRTHTCPDCRRRE